MLSAAVPAAGQNNDRGPVETEVVERTLSLQPGGTLELTTFSGRVNITGGSGDKVVVSATRRARRDRLDAVRLEISQSGNTVTINANVPADTGDSQRDRVVETDFDIQVPSQVNLDLRSFSAPVTVTGVEGNAEIKVFSGDVRLTDVVGPLRVDTFSGGVRLQTSRWNDGDDLEVSSFSGDVELQMPESVRGEVIFEGFSGQFDSDIPVTLTSSDRRNVRGTLNGGGTSEFRLESFSGDMRIRR